VTTIWTYPWTLRDEGVDQALEDLASRGIESITVPSHYHSVQTMQPRTPDALFRQFPGGCYVETDPDAFGDTPIDPPKNRIEGLERPFERIGDAADDHGLDVNAWVVCLHNSCLGAENPTYRIQSAFGDSHDHSLCPSHDAVREYFAAVVSETVSRNVEQVQLESIGFPSVFHGHGATFGHPKRHSLTTDAETWLLSQCFCDACTRKARAAGVDVDRAQRTVTDVLQRSFDDPHSTPLPLASLVREYTVLGDLFEFRAAVVEAFIRRLTEAAGEVAVSTYVGEPGENWPSGVRIRALEPVLDRYLSLCYVEDPSAARDRLRTLGRTVAAPIDAGVDLDPDRIGGPDQLGALTDAIREEIDGDLSLYHHSLLTSDQLDWIETAV